jgi:hypothetical protein
MEYFCSSIVADSECASLSTEYANDEHYCIKDNDVFVSTVILSYFNTFIMTDEISKKTRYIFKPINAFFFIFFFEVP